MEHPETISREKKFIKDLGIYAIGNLGSKLITFLLVPLYTYYITDPAEFGYYDICLTIIFSLGPLISFQLSEGGFRFLIETTDSNRRSSIITYVYISILRNSAILALAALLISLKFDIEYFAYIIFYGIILSIYDVTNQLVRGTGHIKTFMATNIFNAFAIAVFSVLTVVVLGLGVPGLFIANILARITSLFMVEHRTHILSEYFSTCKVDKDINHKLLKYSLPLLPMTMLWWGLNSNNIFFIKEYLGLEENGTYAVLGKFTGILFILANIFYQTWQQNAMEQYESPDRDKLFSKIFNNYIFILCLLASIFPFALRLNYPWLVSQEYQVSSNYLFLNSLYVMTFSLSAFFEVQYQCAKRTSRILPSIIIAIIVNVTLNYLLTEPFGLNGVIISNIITYLTVIVYRGLDTRKYVRLRYDPRSLIYLSLMTAAGTVFYTLSGPMTDITAIIAISIFFSILAPESFKKHLIAKFVKKQC